MESLDLIKLFNKEERLEFLDKILTAIMEYHAQSKVNSTAKGRKEFFEAAIRFLKDEEKSNVINFKGKSHEEIKVVDRCGVRRFRTGTVLLDAVGGGKYFRATARRGNTVSEL